ncbi:hypothetical protein AK88_00320 [Plasmodium fragile]|uniref:Pv-fam-d protein n=1 Tax=Plasmodium fragile TaxID=5857 RepID=A0A0D9QUC2_PLAFR|nr:uncharacterized protein AK88_00320 [Plasmodium fragile]KJP90151.1 hypothetical protein AK88_00320 [Plasmodium fragile]
MKGHNWGIYLLKFLMLPMLAAPWKYSRGTIDVTTNSNITTTDFGEPHNKIVQPDIALNSRTRRLLVGNTDIDFGEKYDPLKDKTINSIDENDDTSRGSLKSKVQHNKFKEQLNTIRCSQNVHNYDQFYESYENVHNYDQFYESYENVHNHDQFYESSETIDSCGESCDKIKYDDEDGKLYDSQHSIDSEVQPYNTVEWELPVMYMYRPKNKSIFSRIFKYLKKAIAKYEKDMYSIQNDYTSQYIKDPSGEIVLTESSNTLDIPCNITSCISISSNKKCVRILAANGMNRTEEQNYVDFKKRINNLLNEDDSAFRERLNTLAQDDYTREQFNLLLWNDIYQKPFKKLAQDKHFQEQLDILKNNNNTNSGNHLSISPDVDHSNDDNNYNPIKSCNNLEEFFNKLKRKNKNSGNHFSTSPDVDHSNDDNNYNPFESCNNMEEFFNKLKRKNKNWGNPFSISPDVDNRKDKYFHDPFESCNSLEDFFNELKIQKDKKEKQIEELTRNQEYKRKAKDELERTNDRIREPTDEVEDYIPFKLEEEEIFERFFGRYGYKDLLKLRKKSALPTFLKKGLKMFEQSVKRFLKQKKTGYYVHNGPGAFGKFLSFIDKHRVFVNILLFIPSAALALSVLIVAIMIIQTTFFWLLSSAAVYPAFVTITVVIVFGLCVP